MTDSEATKRSPQDEVAGTILPDGSAVGELPDLTDMPLRELRDMDPDTRAAATARIVAQVRKSGGGVDPCSQERCGA